MSVRQIRSGLSVTTCIESSVRFERRPWIFEVHIVKEEGGEEALGAMEGEGRTREEVRRVVERVCGIAEEVGERAG